MGQRCIRLSAFPGGRGHDGNHRVHLVLSRRFHGQQAAGNIGGHADAVLYARGFLHRASTMPPVTSVRRRVFGHKAPQAVPVQGLCHHAPLDEAAGQLQEPAQGPLDAVVDGADQTRPQFKGQRQAGSVDGVVRGAMPVVSS
jgi:hypothetical protein